MLTITVAKPEDIPVVRETLRTYEEAFRAKINIQKLKALALGSWNTSVHIMDFPYYEEIKVLRLHIEKNTNATAKQSWNMLTSRIRAQAQEMYQRALDPDQRIQYIHEYLLARAWYMAQTLSPPDENLRHINMTISWFQRKGEIFRSPIAYIKLVVSCKLVIRNSFTGNSCKHCTSKNNKATP
jgi:hypothetical protein